MLTNSYKCSVLVFAVIAFKSHSAATLVPEMSHLNLGTAGAGSAVLAEGASTAYSNPAAMSEMDQAHLAINMAMMNLGIEYQDDRDTSLNSADAGGLQPYGSLYAITPIDERIRLGLSLVATGGSGLDYGNDYAGKVGLNDLQLSVMQFNPSLSYKVNPHLSLGIGIQIDRASFEQTLLAEKATLESTSYALGYNLGVTYLPSSKHQFGITYRSKMEHDLEGEFLFLDQKANSQIELINASRVELSGYHQLNEPIALVWSIGREFWSENEQTSIDLGDIELTKPRGFKDVWFASLGSKVTLSNKFVMDFGIGYVSSPLDESSLQSPDLPVDVQIRYGFGGRYQWDKSTSLNLYYSYVDYGEPEIDNGAMQGRFNNDNHFVGVELDLQF